MAEQPWRLAAAASGARAAVVAAVQCQWRDREGGSSGRCDDDTGSSGSAGGSGGSAGGSGGSAGGR